LEIEINALLKQEQEQEGIIKEKEELKRKIDA